MESRIDPRMPVAGRAGWHAACSISRRKPSSTGRKAEAWKAGATQAQPEELLQGGVMKRKMFLSLTALVLALAVNVAFAQSNSKTKANVPFAFSIEQNAMEAGPYSITVSDRVMKIRNEATNKTVALLAQ